MLTQPPNLEDSELDDDLSVTTLKFQNTPEWLRFLSGIVHGFPLKTQFGTLWRAVDRSANGKDIHGRTAFVRAVIEGDLRYAEMLAEYRYTDVSSPDKHGQTALHWACRKRLPDMVGLCLMLPALDSNVKDDENLTAFDIASRAGDEAIQALFYKKVLEVEKTDPNAALLRLLTVSAEPERGADFPDEALFGPVLGDHVPLVKALLASGANLAATNKDQETVLHLAAKRGFAPMVSILLQNSSRGVRADSEAVAKNRLTALHYAVAGGHLEAARVLINQGADRQAKNSEGKTACDLAQGKGALAELFWKSSDQTRLHRAVIEGRTARVAQLVDIQSVLDKDSKCMTALHHAAELGNTEVVKILLAKGAAPNAKTKYWMTPLHFAAIGGHAEVMELLLAPRVPLESHRDYRRAGLVRGAEPKMIDYHSRSAMHYAANSGHTEAVRLLLKHGVRYDRDTYRKTELHYAASNGHIETVELLLGEGSKAPVDHTDGTGMRALSHAAVRGHTQMVVLLLAHKAVPTAVDLVGRTALHHAAGAGQTKIVKLLLDEIADRVRKAAPESEDDSPEGAQTAALELRDHHSKTAISLAVRGGCVDTVLLMMSYGAVLEVNDYNDRTLLHHAARNGHTEMVGLLFDRIPTYHRQHLLEAKDSNGQTALHHAAYHDYLDTVKFLLACGAVLEVTDKLKETPLSLAQKHSYSNVAIFLQALGTRGI